MCVWTDNFEFHCGLAVQQCLCVCHQTAVMHEAASTVRLFQSITAALVWTD
jgi:hypothetical protein